MGVAQVTVLIPTADRVSTLIATLISLCFQTFNDFDLIISDQSQRLRPFEDPSVKCALTILLQKGHSIRTFTHLPRLGMGEQREFLLDKSLSVYSLFLDDDLVLEPNVIENMVRAIKDEKCGFIGCAPIGLSYRYDLRPDEQAIEFWNSEVTPELIRPGTDKWERYKLHNAANILHVAEKLSLNHMYPRKYKVAWVGGCVLYDTEKLRKSGGFSFWKQLRPQAAGEDVLAEIRVMEKYGGAGLIPSGVYHQEAPTTLKERKENAPDVLFREL